MWTLRRSPPCCGNTSRRSQFGAGRRAASQERKELMKQIDDAKSEMAQELADNQAKENGSA